MSLRIAIAGLRHGHITGLIKLIDQTDGVGITACAEGHPPTRDAMADHVRITHDDPMRMLDETECDIVGIGDTYGRRGALAIAALERGRHVISDKPICTSLEELERIVAISKERGLSVGCQFDLPNTPVFVQLRQLVRSGTLGEVHQVNFGGQHPLLYGKRPGWYFEPGEHGGTINDIAVHAMHLIPWLTGQPLARVIAARTWNAFAKDEPHFNDAAQLMMTLGNGAGVVGDVSYAAPTKLGYALPQYWRFTLWGTGGMAETSLTADAVTLVRDQADQPEHLPGRDATEPDYFASFLHEVRGEADRAAVTTADVLRAAAAALEAQAVADEGRPGATSAMAK